MEMHSLPTQCEISMRPLHEVALSESHPLPTLISPNVIVYFFIKHIQLWGIRAQYTTPSWKASPTVCGILWLVNSIMPSQISSHIKSHSSASEHKNLCNKQHPQKRYILALPIKVDNSKVINSEFWNKLHDFTGLLLTLQFSFLLYRILSIHSSELLLNTYYQSIIIFNSYCMLASALGTTTEVKRCNEESHLPYQ